MDMHRLHYITYTYKRLGNTNGRRLLQEYYDEGINTCTGALYNIITAHNVTSTLRSYMKYTFHISQQSDPINAADITKQRNGGKFF